MPEEEAVAAARQVLARIPLSSPLYGLPVAIKDNIDVPSLPSTSAFAPKHYPQEIISYANTRGADKIIYAGYFPMGLTLERIFSDMPHVPFKDHVWPKFLSENARRVLKIDA